MVIRSYGSLHASIFHPYISRLNECILTSYSVPSQHDIGDIFKVMGSEVKVTGSKVKVTERDGHIKSGKLDTS